MAIILFAFWLILNGRFTWETTATGAVLSVLIELFLIKFMGYSIKKEIAALKLLPSVLRYLKLLVTEIFKSSYAVTKLIFSPRLEPEPQLKSFESKLHTRAGRTALANSITLTPGTITVSIEDDTYTVHSLDKMMMDGIDDTAFQKALMKMEAKADGR